MTATLSPALTSTLENLTAFVIEEVNRFIKNEFSLYGKTLQDLKDSMSTADFTKFLQYIINEVIEEGIKQLGIDGIREEVTGYDFVIDGQKIEFKLNGSDDKSSFATGNKTSHFGGAKANFVWCIKYVFTDNQISEFAMVLIDTDKTESNVWKSSSGRKDSFSTLRLGINEEECIMSQMGIVRPADKWLQLLTLPTEILLG